jgi:hypothetical protein
MEALDRETTDMTKKGVTVPMIEIGSKSSGPLSSGVDIVDKLLKLQGPSEQSAPRTAEPQTSRDSSVELLARIASGIERMTSELSKKTPYIEKT